MNPACKLNPMKSRFSMSNTTAPDEAVADENSDEREIYESLHVSGRIADFLPIEEHLKMAARLSRALWQALDNDHLSIEERTRLGLECLASEVADHASAAEVLYRLGFVRGSGPK
jgi:hypothetical protein